MPEHSLDSFLSPDARRQSELHASRRLRDLLDSRSLIKPSNLTLAREEAFEYLNDCRLVIEDHIKKEYSGYSRYQWLYWLRRLPIEVLKGRLSTTETYDQWMAEALAGTKAEDFTKTRSTDGRLNFALDDHVRRRVLRFVAWTKLLSQIYVLIRYTGKGAVLVTEKSNPLPRVNTDPETARAIEEYDRRNTIPIDSSTTNGILLFREGAGNFQIPIYGKRSEPRKLSVQGESTLARYQLTQFSIDSFSEICHNLDLGPRSGSMFLELLLILICSQDYLSRQNRHFMNVLETGYFIAVRDDFVDFARHRCEKVLATSSPFESVGPLESLLDALVSIPCSVWPTRSAPPVLSLSADHLLIDLYTASRLVSNMTLTLSNGGSLGDFRGQSFQDSVQELIDSSPCKPNPELRQMRKQLRRNNQSIGDIDALAERDNKLYLIECKSLVYTPEYDNGVHRAVRNVVTEIEEKLKQQNLFINTLRRFPVGDNYDFANRELVSVICTSFVPYLPLRILELQSENNLRRVISFNELKNWLVKPNVKQL